MVFEDNFVSVCRLYHNCLLWFVCICGLYASCWVGFVCVNRLYGSCWLCFVCVCRLYGSYQALDGGLPDEGLVDLTGGIVETFEFSEGVPDNLYSILCRAHKRSSLMVCNVLPVSHTHHPDVIWAPWRRKSLFIQQLMFNETMKQLLCKTKLHIYRKTLFKCSSCGKFFDTFKF